MVKLGEGWSDKAWKGYEQHKQEQAEQALTQVLSDLGYVELHDADRLPLLGTVSAYILMGDLGDEVRVFRKVQHA